MDEIAKLQAEQAQLQQILQGIQQQANEITTRLVEIQGVVKYLLAKPDEAKKKDESEAEG